MIIPKYQYKIGICSVFNYL